MSDKINEELLTAFCNLLESVNDYADYEWSGDPYEEDRRAMGEMEIDDLKHNGKLEEYNKLAESLKCKGQ